MNVDEILKKYGLKYEQLSQAEVETLNDWLKVFNENKVNIEKIREYVSSMKAQVEEELTKTGHESKQDTLLKARLRNYMLLEAFLSTPEKARKALEATIAGITNKKS